MKKIVLIMTILLTFLAAAFAEKKASYKVSSVTGKVTYEVSSGVWSDVKVGMELDESSNINVGLNSTLKLDLDGTSYSIKPMKKGKLASLVSAKSKTGIKVGSKVTEDDIAEASTKTSKGTSTASSRASEAKADVEWEF
ncbi:MAG: hypothetical protein K6C97_00255 [Treponema sp.]|nr:hypothetical protein [Treponema sp.]